jgi:hypothetical protein
MALDPLIAAFLDAARNRRTDKPLSLLEMRQVTEVDLQKLHGPLEQVMDAGGVEVKSVHLVGIVHAGIHMFGLFPQARQLFDHARAGLQGALKFSAEAAIRAVHRQQPICHW